MTPYFKDKSVKLFLGDSLELLKQIPAESVDMIFADPPYNLSNGGFSCHAGKRVSVNKGKWDESKGIEEDFKGLSQITHKMYYRGQHEEEQIKYHKTE